MCTRPGSSYPIHYFGSIPELNFVSVHIRYFDSIPISVCSRSMPNRFDTFPSSREFIVDTRQFPLTSKFRCLVNLHPGVSIQFLISLLCLSTCGCIGSILHYSVVSIYTRMFLFISQFRCRVCLRPGVWVNSGFHCRFCPHLDFYSIPDVDVVCVHTRVIRFSS